MSYINENYLELQDSYLFSTIAKKVAKFTEENPDTSSAWTHAFVERESGETHGGSYTDIVDSLPCQVITNPIKSTDLIDSPVAKTLKFGKNKMPKDAIKKIFKLF